jgi:chorismate-pyruvate lyase
VPHAYIPNTTAMASQQQQMATVESGLYRTVSFGMDGAPVVGAISLIRQSKQWDEDMC